MIKKKRASISARPLQLSLSLRGMFARSYLLQLRLTGRTSVTVR